MSARPAFWKSFFQARAQGCPTANLKSVLSGLPKTVLAQGARHLLISAARAKDTASFGELLDLGAARRSKLVMFSAYQNGGMKLALQVKVPTSMEASEMLGNATHSRRSARDMVHEAGDFLWLLELSKQPVSSETMAHIIAGAVDPMAFEEVVRNNIDHITLVEERQYDYQSGTHTKSPVTRKIKEVILALSSVGCPSAAKALAIAKGGDELWRQVCVDGFSEAFTLPVRLPSKNVKVAHCKVGGAHIQGGAGKVVHTTAQHAAALSRHPEACKWLRAEYESLGARWLPSQELVTPYKLLQKAYNEWGIDGTRLSQEALSMSEAVELYGGIKVEKPLVAPKRGRAL